MRILLSVTLIAAPIAAYGQPLTQYGPHLGVLPPLQYDYEPPTGMIVKVRAGAEEIAQICPKTMFPVTLGCAYRLSDGRCRMIIATDDILNAAGWPYEVVYRHERGHCNGFPKDHKGARPIGSPEGKAPIVFDYRREKRMRECEAIGIQCWEP